MPSSFTCYSPQFSSPKPMQDCKNSGGLGYSNTVMAKDPFPQPLHDHQRRVWSLLLEKTMYFLIWFVLVTSVFLLSFIYSPNPFRTVPNEEFRVAWNDQNKGGGEIGGGGGCDLFDGQWVKDYGGSVYTNQSCKTIPESKNCGKYGKEEEYVNWRWKPRGCEVPRFDGEKFLKMVRGKKMAFVGDSVARNQMESLLCLLSQVETPRDIQKDDEDRFRTWYFPSHDFTLMTLWTKFLVAGPERMVNGSGSGVFDLHLDKLDTAWTEKVPLINYMVISSGHWFFRQNHLYEGGKRIGCVYCSEQNMTDLGVTFAVRRAFRTALQFINRYEKSEGLLAIVRTFSPAHFENGSWNGGGTCNRTQPLNEGEVSLSGTSWELRQAQVEELQNIKTEERKGMKWFKLLDVTKAMMSRADAHPGLHWNNKWMNGYSDCVHWCLPGPVDWWNELLLEVLKRDSLLY